MSIARYDLTEDCTTGKVDITPVPETMECRYVSYEDYAALESRCSTLAAENAGLKEYLAPVGLALEGAPATDAFLAEVRASGVDYAIGVIKYCANNLCPGGTGEAVQYAQEMVTPYLDSIHDKLADKSAQLRKGVQS